THRPNPGLPAFPTRRSSDLPAKVGDLSAGLTDMLCVSDHREVDHLSALLQGPIHQQVPSPLRVPPMVEGNGEIPQRQGSSLAERSEEHTSELQSRFDIVCSL